MITTKQKALGINSEIQRVLLLGVTFSTGNMGVGALAAGALKVIKTSYPHVQINFLDYGRTSREDIVDVNGHATSVPLINMRFSWKIFLSNNIILLLVLAVLARYLGNSNRRRIINKNRWLKKIDMADLVFAVSGGDSFSDIYGFERFIYVSLPQLLVVLLGKPIVLLPQTIGPFHEKISKGLARFILHRAIVVYSREHEGVLNTKNLLGSRAFSNRVHFCYDIGFVIDARAPDTVVFDGCELAARDHSLIIGLNISGLLLNKVYSPKNEFGLNVDYRSLMHEIIRFLIDVCGFTVLLVPHVFGHSQENDVDAVSDIYSELGDFYQDRLVCLRGHYDQHEIKHIIGTCDFFIGSRMHACIGALSQEIPAIGIAYSDKFRGVFESVGVGHLVADPRHIEANSLLELLRVRLQERHDIERHLREVMPGVSKTVLGVLNELSM